MAFLECYLNLYCNHPCRFNYIAMKFIMQHCLFWLCTLVVKLFVTQDFVRLKNKPKNVVELFMVVLL